MGGEGFGFRRARLSPGAQIPRHVHDGELELVYIEKGSGKLAVGEKTRSFKSGDVVLLPPDIPHVWLFDYVDVDAEGKTVNGAFFFSGEKLLRVCELMPAVGGRIIPLLKRKAPVLLKGMRRMAAAELMQRAEKTGPTAKFGRLLEVLELFAAQTMKNEASAKVQHDEERSEKEALQLYLECNYMRDISLADCAKEFGRNRTSFCGWFKSATGMTFAQAVIRLRLRHAAGEMLSTHDGIAKIAAGVGYSDVAFFSRHFKRLYGESPAHWRAHASPEMI